MKTVTMFETFDGALHRTVKDAVRHLDAKLADIVCPLARALGNAKYAERVEALAKNELESLRAIIRIHEDMKLEDDEEPSH